MHVIAGEPCAALREELLPNVRFLLRVFVSSNLPFTRSCWTNDSRMATKHHSSLQSATGKTQRFSKMSYVCVVPQLRAAFLPTCHVDVAAHDVQARPPCVLASRHGGVDGQLQGLRPRRRPLGINAAEVHALGSTRLLSPKRGFLTKTSATCQRMVLSLKWARPV